MRRSHEFGVWIANPYSGPWIRGARNFEIGPVLLSPDQLLAPRNPAIGYYAAANRSCRDQGLSPRAEQGSALPPDLWSNAISSWPVPPVPLSIQGPEQRARSIV